MLCITRPLEGDHRQAFLAIPKQAKKLETGNSCSFCLVLTLVDSVRGAQNTQEKLKLKCQFTCKCCCIILSNSIMQIDSYQMSNDLKKKKDKKLKRNDETFFLGFHTSCKN